MKDAAVYQKMLANRRQFDRYQVIYHTPGQRRCSTGEHMHMSRPDNYNLNSFCYDRTCNWATECSNIRLKNFDMVDEFNRRESVLSQCASKPWCPDCFDHKE
jgi:hypothetical protein